MVPHMVPFSSGIVFLMGRFENLEKLHAKFKISQSNINFSDLCRLAEMVGFSFDRQNGSHKVYRHAKYPGIMNFQDVRGKGKPYQVKQLLNFIDEHDLLKKDDGNV